jgi:hypothetical protein
LEVLMRRLIWISAAGIALLGAGIAVAHEGHANSVKTVSATFNATTASDVHTNSCTGTDGTYTTTRGHWSGLAAGDPTLSGNATIDATILVGPAGDGVVAGKLRIDGANHTSAHFEAVIDKAGNLAGLAEGHGSAPWNKLIANVSANWTATGFTGGKLGGGTSAGNAVVLTSGGCKSASTKPETIEAHGALTLGANNATVTVAGVTCNVPSDLSTKVANLHSGDRVEIKCTSASGANTLTRIERKGDQH